MPKQCKTCRHFGAPKQHQWVDDDDLAPCQYYQTFPDALQLTPAWVWEHAGAGEGLMWGRQGEHCPTWERR